MNSSSQLVQRLDGRARRRNRELATDAGFKALLGIGFSLATFGMLFWFGWYCGLLYNGSTAPATVMLDGNGTEFWTMATLSVGTHSFSALYNGNTNCIGGSTSELLQAVNHGDFTTTFLGPAGSASLS